MEHFCRGQAVDLPREIPPRLLDGPVRRRWIGLDVGAGQGLDIEAGVDARLLHAGARKDDRLVERGGVMLPEVTVGGPDPLGVDDPELPLGSGGE